MELNKSFKSSTFTFIKYLMTVGGIFFLSAPLIAFLFMIDKISLTKNTALAIILLLELFSIIFIGVFTFFRIYLHIKTNFKYNLKEKKYLILSFSFMWLSFILSFILSLLLLHLNVNHILFYVIYAFIFIIQVISSIFESLTRVHEMIAINQMTNSIKNVKKNSVNNENSEKQIKKNIDKSKITTKIIEKGKNDNPFLQEKEEIDND
ncbi:hypothetical protein [Spiroplasma endosymbiont of Labia minor]|uniref:hypothetical protein n=1 Tax=Spiroplasma endosymbiont of Labia minor TaxID=3066305 RepID=UPI0030CC138F